MQITWTFFETNANYTEIMQTVKTAKNFPSNVCL